VPAVREVYLIPWDQPQLVVDITDVMDLKLQAVACHASQVGDVKAVEGRVRGRAAALGKAKGYPYAEALDPIVLPG
jgi:LmbE family N-acetylglucosaminyl deacetylase